MNSIYVPTSEEVKHINLSQTTLQKVHEHELFAIYYHDTSHFSENVEFGICPEVIGGPYEINDVSIQLMMQMPKDSIVFIFCSETGRLHKVVQIERPMKRNNRTVGMLSWPGSYYATHHVSVLKYFPQGVEMKAIYKSIRGGAKTEGNRRQDFHPRNKTLYYVTMEQFLAILGKIGPITRTPLIDNV